MVHRFLVTREEDRIYHAVFVYVRENNLKGGQRRIPTNVTKHLWDYDPQVPDEFDVAVIKLDEAVKFSYDPVNPLYPVKFGTANSSQIGKSLDTCIIYKFSNLILF